MNTSQRDDDTPLRWSRYRPVVDCITGNNVLLSLLAYVPQWQTLEEFKRDPVEGWCWIARNKEILADMSYHSGGLFYFDDACDKTVYDVWDENDITHVMPIPTPEVPK